MDCFNPRRIMALCIAVLITAVNGGVLALAVSADTASAANVSSVIEAAVAVDQTDQLSACCDDLDEILQARQSTPSCKVGSSDCGGPLPSVGALSGGSTNLWMMVAVTAHRDYLSEHHLRPPRL